MSEESQVNMTWIVIAAALLLWFMKSSGSTSAPIPEDFGVTDPNAGWD